MLAEWIMERHGWDAVWFLGSNRPHPRWWQFARRDACYVGTWTGPDMDLICVRRCETDEEAEQWLSPGGRTILHAALRSWWRLRGHRRGLFCWLGSHRWWPPTDPVVCLRCGRPIADRER